MHKNPDNAGDPGHSAEPSPLLRDETRSHHTSNTRTEILVEVIGIEPTTPCLQSRCSPS